MPQCLYIKNYDGVPVACGKCMYCKNKRVAGWAARLMNKEMHSSFAFFVTFTYDTEHLMFCPKNRPTLYPNHLTAYWKKLRKFFPEKAISYYACGEYGSNKKRPHYHAIVFFNNEKIQPLYAIKQMEQCWEHGEIFVGTVTAESVAYTLKYISKKPSVPQYRGDTRTREFQRSSKGLGLDYISRDVLNWHYDLLTERAYIPLNGGGKAPIPRYLKDKIYSKEQKRIIGEYMQENTTSRNYDQLKIQRLENIRKINS